MSTAYDPDDDGHLPSDYDDYDPADDDDPYLDDPDSEARAEDPPEGYLEAEAERQLERHCDLVHGGGDVELPPAGVAGVPAVPPPRQAAPLVPPLGLALRHQGGMRHRGTLDSAGRVARPPALSQGAVLMGAHTPAQELRAAAKLMRELAHAVPPVTPGQPGVTIGGTDADAEFLASWHPDAALAAAALLEAVAAVIGDAPEDELPAACQRAIDFARAYLGARMPAIQSSRLREARDYVGFTREDVARACGWDVDRIITLEDGTGGPMTGLELRKLARLYRRPVAWFSGESRYQPSADLLRHVEDLHPGDREAVLDFAEWLAGAQ